MTYITKQSYKKGHCKIAFKVCDICLCHVVIFYVHVHTCIFIDDLMIPNDACM